MPRFYLDIKIAVGDMIKLSPEIVRHVTVLRLTSGEHLTVFDGDGKSYDATLVSLTKKNAQIIVNEELLAKNIIKPRVNLYMSIISSDKMDLIIRAVTELNIKSITPIISQFTQGVSADKLRSRYEHWRKIVISACEQSGRNDLPTLNHPLIFKNLLAKQPLPGNAYYILSTKLDGKLGGQLSQDAEVSLLIGPEGGFSLDEEDMAISSGYQAVKLATNVLRAETAAIAAVAIVNECIN